MSNQENFDRLQAAGGIRMIDEPLPVRREARPRPHHCCECCNKFLVCVGLLYLVVFIGNVIALSLSHIPELPPGFTFDVILNIYSCIIFGFESAAMFLLNRIGSNLIPPSFALLMAFI